MHWIHGVVIWLKICLLQPLLLLKSFNPYLETMGVRGCPLYEYLGVHRTGRTESQWVHIPICFFSSNPVSLFILLRKLINFALYVLVESAEIYL